MANTKKKDEPIATMPPEDKENLPVDQVLKEGEPEGKTITSDELKKSTQPLAPEHPLEAPDAEDK